MPSQRSPDRPIRKYDIFREDSCKGPLWIETVVGLDEAKRRVLQLHAQSPGNYRVFDPLAGAFIEFRSVTSA